MFSNTNKICRTQFPKPDLMALINNIVPIELSGRQYRALAIRSNVLISFANIHNSNKNISVKNVKLSLKPEA